MKLIRIITSFVLAIVIMALPVLATDTDISSEKEIPVKFIIETDEDNRQIIGSIYNENDEFVRYIYYDELIITTLWEFENLDIDIHENIEETLLSAKEELSNEEWTSLVKEFEEKWEEATNGAPVSNAIIAYIFDVRYASSLVDPEEKLLEKGQYAKFNIEAKDVEIETLFLIGHKPAGSEDWVVEDHEIDEDGVITIEVDSLSPFFIAVDSGESPNTGDAPDSPQTGVNNVTLYVSIASGIVFAAVALYLTKKLRKVSVQ